MNSIVSKRVVTKTDLIEQQAERIAELEAYNQTRTDELAAAARRIAELEAAERERTALALELTEEVERQEARIEELEAEVDANLQERVRMQHTINQYESGDKVSRHYACPDCAALRQRIADAPVVAWLHEVRRDSDVITDQVRHLWGRVPVAVGKEAHYTIPLIRKEGLK